MIVAIALIAVIGGAETFLQSGSGGSLIISLTFWLAIAQGCVALMAAPTIVKAEWHKPIMPQMLSANMMMPIIAVAFLLMSLQTDIYPWNDDPGRWLNKNLFLGRHVVWIMVTFFIARKFASEALKGTDAARRYAVFYILAFVIQQSMVGFEWIMTLEKPWFSTLLGAFFFVESFQSGICIAAIALFIWRHRFDDDLRLAQKSIGGLMFGFATFWAYTYFSQLIVIWYGNLPSEVNFLAKRIGYHTDYWAIARFVFAACWVLPFFILLGRAPKKTPAITLAMALLIFVGFAVEKWLLVSPVVPVNILLLLVDFACLGAIFVTVMRSGGDMLPAAAPGPSPALEAAKTH